MRNHGVAAQSFIPALGASRLSGRPPDRAAYFVNAPFDIAFVGGISIVAFLSLRLFGPRAYSSSAATLAVYLMWVINWPHFSATLYRLFRSRESRRQYPITAYGIPLLCYGAALGALGSPSVLAPWLIKIFLIWSPYHFSGQSVGVSLIYARRQGVKLDRWPRLALSAFIFGTYAVPTLRAEVASASSYYGIAYPPLGVAAWMPAAALGVMLLGGVGFLVFALHWSVRTKRLFPLMILLPGLTQFVWFIAGSGVQAFYVFVPCFHSLQYLPMAWAMELGLASGEGSCFPAPGGTPHFVRNQTLRWAGWNLLGGWILFWALPHLVALSGLGLELVTGVLIAGVQIHHFFVDGVIWKLRDYRVASPLLANVSDYGALPGPLSAREAA